MKLWNDREVRDSRNIDDNGRYGKMLSPMTKFDRRSSSGDVQLDSSSIYIALS